tara:strand:+ start:149 stop:544 length:396 start_codon:yes stop_codon:yes gene_type:complete
VIVEFHKKVIENKGGAFPTTRVSPVFATWSQVQAGTLRYDQFDLALFGFYLANCKNINQGIEFLQIFNSFLPKHQRADLDSGDLDRAYVAKSYALKCRNRDEVMQHLFERIPQIYSDYKQEMQKSIFSSNK